jgi:hypothetical protein
MGDFSPLADTFKADQRLCWLEQVIAVQHL